MSLTVIDLTHFNETNTTCCLQGPALNTHPYMGMWMGSLSKDGLKAL